MSFYKEKLTFYRLLLTFVITAISGCTAWVFVQYPACGIPKTAVTIITIAALGVLALKLIMSIKFCLGKIKELE